MTPLGAPYSQGEVLRSLARSIASGHRDSLTLVERLAEDLGCSYADAWQVLEREARWPA